MYHYDRSKMTDAFLLQAT